MKLVALLALSASLQACRRSLVKTAIAPKIPTATKRAFRVSGFLLAAFLPCSYSLLLSMGTVIFGAALLRASGARSYSRVANKLTSETYQVALYRRLSLLMILHQTHYFVYAYAVLYLAFHIYAESINAAALSFALGWITYLSAERLWRRFPDRRVFICGHIFLAICLLSMSVIGSASWVSVLLWIMTGFGGGSVYCLVSISSKAGLTSKHVEYTEDIGHLSGVLIALGLVSTGATFGGLAAVGAAFAAIAAVMMFSIPEHLEPSPGLFLKE